MLQLSSLALLQQLNHQLSPILQVLETTVLLFSRKLAAGLNIQKSLIKVSILPVKGVMAVAFFEQSLALFLKVLLGNLRAFLVESLLALKVLLCNVWVFPESVLIVLLGVIDLTFDIFLPAPPQALQLLFNLLFLQLLSMLLYCKLFFEPSTGIKLSNDRTHLDNKFYRQLIILTPIAFTIKNYLTSLLHLLRTVVTRGGQTHSFIMQREEFSPDIEVKFQQLVAHMTQKNATVEQFLRILRQVCDAEIFYSRSLDKFANNVSKLIMGKDPLKEVLIIFERALAAKAEQSLELAQNIKEDMIPFLEASTVDHQQQQLKNQQQPSKDIRSTVERKLQKLRITERQYLRVYEQLKKYSNVDSRTGIEDKERLQRQLAEKEESLSDTIESYNHSIEEYLLAYTAICDRLSDIQTRRKSTLRDAINKFMIFEISCLKNIEYNIPRYMKSLQKMSDKLFIQDKIVPSSPHPESPLHLATISIPNYLSHIQDAPVEVPLTHRRILDLKKSTPTSLSIGKFHQLATQLHVYLDETASSHDLRVLKEVVYFASGVSSSTSYNSLKKRMVRQVREPSSITHLHQDNPSVSEDLLLLDAVMCHPIFEDTAFWHRYEKKLFDIIDREKRMNYQNKDMQINLGLLSGDMDFLKKVSYHPLPSAILSKFQLGGEQGQMACGALVESERLRQYLGANIQFME